MTPLFKLDIQKLIVDEDFDGLVHALRHAKQPVRDEAARAICLFKASEGEQPIFTVEDKQAAKPLAMLLRDSDPKIRLGACRALGETGNPRAVNLLIERLEADNTSAIRRAAAEALGQIGSQGAVDPLLRSVADKNINVQRTAVEALGKIGDPRAAAPICKALKQGYFESDGRVAALRALGPLGDKEAIPILIDALKEWDDRILQAATFSLRDMPDPLALESLLPLLHRSGPTSKIAGEAILRIGPPAIPALLQSLDGEDWEFQRKAALLLRKLGWQPDDSQPLLQRYMNRDWEGLAMLGEPAVEPLIYALDKTNAYASRCHIIEALGKTGASGAVEPLIELLNSTERALSGQAALALKELGKPAVEPLTKLCQAPNVGIWYRKILVEILCQIGDPQATDAFTALLKSSLHEERVQAVEALAICGHAGALNALHGALRSEQALLKEEYDKRDIPPEIIDTKQKEFQESVQRALDQILSRGW